MHVRTVLGGVVAAGALALAPGVAAADEAGQTAAAINQAVAAEGTTPAANNPDVSIPSTGTGLVALGSPGAEIAVELPARGAADQAGHTTVFDGETPGVKVAVQPTADGIRALVQIESAKAPERYPFAMSGDVARLEQNADGSISGYGADGQLSTQIAPAWARDAKGRDVPTFYEIEGTTVVQVVRHRGGDWAYGITADPFWDTAWKVVKCGAAIGGFIAGNALLVLKVRKFGGVVKVAKVLVSAGSVERKLKAAVAIFGEVAGITGVVSACK